jgi:hypothetical protein
MRRSSLFAALLISALSVLCFRLSVVSPNSERAGVNETAQPAESPGIGEAASTSLLQPEDNAHSQSNDAPETDGETRDPGDSVQSTATDARVDELLDLPMTDRPGALWTILSELSNSNLRIRKAAVEAAVQFGSRDAVAALKEALADANDAEEKSEIARAINLLALPSMSEAVPPGADTSR